MREDVVRSLIWKEFPKSLAQLSADMWPRPGACSLSPNFPPAKREATSSTFLIGVRTTQDAIWEALSPESEQSKEIIRRATDQSVFQQVTDHTTTCKKEKKTLESLTGVFQYR